MQTIRRITAVLVFATLAACATVGPPATDIGECAASKVGSQVKEIKPQVLNCLAARDYMPCLESIGRTVGMDVLICAVREFTGVGAGSTNNPAVRENAKAYLATKGNGP